MLELPASENMAINKARKQGFVKFTAVTLGPDCGKNAFNTQVLCNACLTLLEFFHKLH